MKPFKIELFDRNHLLPKGSTFGLKVKINSEEDLKDPMAQEILRTIARQILEGVHSYYVRITYTDSTASTVILTWNPEEFHKLALHLMNYKQYLKDTGHTNDALRCLWGCIKEEFSEIPDINKAMEKAA